MQQEGDKNDHQDAMIAKKISKGKKKKSVLDKDKKNLSVAIPDFVQKNASFKLNKKGSALNLAEAPKKSLTSRQLALKFTEHKYFVTVMMFATFGALFGTDLWEFCGPPPIETDFIIYSIMAVCFFVFLLEFSLLTWSKDGYSLSFFWWLDLLAAISLLPDALMAAQIDLITLLGGGTSMLTITRAGRAARAGTRAVRIISVLKKQYEARRDKAKGIVKQEDGEEQESMIGGKLGDGITEKVIVIVTLMLISNELFNLLVFVTETDFHLTLLNLENFYIACGASKEHRGCSHIRTNCTAHPASSDPTCHFNLYLRQVVADHNGERECGSAVEEATVKACRLELFDRSYDWTTYSFQGPCQVQQLRQLRLLGHDLFCNADAVASLRTIVNERIVAELPSSDSLLVFDNVPFARGEAIVSILQVCFIIVILGTSSYLFQRDSDQLVIGPLSRMAKVVETLLANPLAQIEETEGGDYETDFVERAIKKFGKLLQIAFGEAGSEIIGKNNMDSDGAVNPMVAGRKMQAIFGFAIIRAFTDCTECLQEEVMLFVNTIADILHRSVKKEKGAPNKNIGDAFLLAWRLPDAANLSAPHDDIAECALRACVRTCVETQASDNLRRMTENPKIQERIPGYTTSMGYGLHVGWAIEGAIGSMLKIDASYLSPNVNLAARLETGTNQFGVDILISEQVFSMIRPDVQKLLRKIDCVTMKGSTQPIALYTYDVPRVTANTIEELYKEAEEEEEEFDFWDYFRPLTSTTYRKRHADAVQLYLEGNWLEAKKSFELCLLEWADDGPSKVVMNFMRGRNFRPPDDWQGFRVLTSK